jgi:hypothetical protein
MLKRFSLLAAAGAISMMLMPGAQALTPAPLDLPTDAVQVAAGCGPGWYRGPYGRCVRGGVRVRPIAVCRTVRTAYGWRKVCR